MEAIVIEVTQEEVEAILEAREKRARKEEIEKNIEIIKESLRTIEKLGGHVHLPDIGGKYVPRYSPRVTAKNIGWY
jgi:hypothetical protein